MFTSTPARYVIALFFVALATLIFVACRRWLGNNEASLFYLPVVMACAVRLGFGAAIFASVASFLSWDYYFLPPTHTLIVDSPSSWIAMTVFAITAVVTSTLAATVREQARSALVREREMATLLKASELVSNAVDSDETLLKLLREACTSYCSPCAVIYECQRESDALQMMSFFGDFEPTAEFYNGAQATRAIVDNTVVVDLPKSDGIGGGIYAPIYHLGDAIGVFYVRLYRIPNSTVGSDTRLLTTLASHAAVVIARRRGNEQSQAKIRENAILDERRRLAQEVHDSLSNTFNSIRFLLEAAKRAAPGESVQDCIDLALTLAVDGAQESRRSVWSLRPVAFDDAGTLGMALRRLVENSGNNPSTTVRISIIGVPINLNPNVEDNLYRIAQEALTNALRHAKASVIEVTLSYGSKVLELSVKDNGVGFDRHRNGSNGVGLENIAARSNSMGAEFTLSSDMGIGTSIIVKAGIEASHANR